MLHKVREKARISPYGVFYLNIEDEFTSDGRLFISNEDQISILQKFHKDNLLFNVEFDRNDTRATIILMYIGKDSNENPYETKKEASGLETKVLGGLLVVIEDTGFVGLNKAGKVLNPRSQEFKVLKVLMDSKNHQATYSQLLGKEDTKSKRRTLGFVIRNLKEALGILPKKKAKNKDIIQNIKGHGYKLLT